MSTKRILAAILGTLMLVALAVPAFAYSTANEELVEKSYYTSKATISGGYTYFDLFGSTSSTAAKAEPTISTTDEKGALHITNTTTANKVWQTGAKGKTNSSDAYSQFVDNTKGMTFDLYAKLIDLPILSTNAELTDEGAVNRNQSNLYFSGLVFNICSSEKYMADTTKSNNELNAVFAHYENDELGTDTVLILPYGNRNAFANCDAVCYFFTRDTENYERYTLKFDAVNGTTEFFINGEAIAYDLTDETVFDGIGLCYRATATTNFININLNNGQGAVVANEGTTDFYLDQLNVYPEALTPAEDFLFEEEPQIVQNANFTKLYNVYRDFAPMADEYYNPTFWNALEEFINYGLDLIADGDQEGLNALSDSGTGANWFYNRMTFKSTAGANTLSGGSAATVNGTGTVIPAATPILVGYDKFYVSHIDSTGTNAGWSYSSTLVTKAGIDPNTITCVGGGKMSNVWRVYTFEPTHVEDVYKLIDVGGLGSARTVIPEGGFSVVFHMNGKNNTNINNLANIEDSKYNSCLFFARNVHAVYAAGKNGGSIGKNLYYKFTGLDLANGTIDTEGTWLTYKDPALNGGAGDHVYRAGYIALDAADAEGRTTATRDKFVGFKTNTYFEYYADELPAAGETMNVTVKGNGSVTAAINGNAVALDAITSTASDVVTLTASGEGFKYWVGGNDAILGTDAEITLPGGKALNIIAVFEDSADAETVNVYFKDNKTGKVWASKEVAVGTALDTSDVVVPSLKGFTFAGWDVEDGTIINATTEVYTTYTRATDTVAITIINGSREVTVNRAYGAIAAVTAKAADFSYWTLNGVIVSTDRDFTFNAPSADCTLEAVSGKEAPATVAAAIDLSKEGQNFYFLMSRSGDVKETGVLMTRKGTAADLTVDTTLNTVTRGKSTAAADVDVVGFVKDATGKAGTWLVRGYVIDNAGNVTYTDILSVVID